MGTHDFTKENPAAEQAALSKEQAQQRAFDAGMEAYNQKNYQAAVTHWIEAARLGSLAAIKNLRILCANEKLDTYNPGAAFQFALVAAKMGDAESQFHCGRMYASGAGVSADKAEALYWYEKAAEQGVAAAQFNCGSMYRSGEGTAADMTKAFYWWERAAEQGFANAQFACGYMYCTGKGTADDLAKGVHWVEKAAEQGHEQAQKILPELRARVEQLMQRVFNAGVEAYNQKDYRAAVTHWTEAAHSGNLTAMQNLRALHINKELDTYNPEEAFRWVLKAAELGDAESQFYCAQMYASGTGISADKAKALYWCEKAAEQGYEQAQKTLEALRAQAEKEKHIAEIYAIYTSIEDIGEQIKYYDSLPILDQLALSKAVYSAALGSTAAELMMEDAEKKRQAESFAEKYFN